MQYSFFENVELSCFCVLAVLGDRIPYQEQKYKMYIYNISICPYRTHLCEYKLYSI